MASPQEVYPEKATKYAIAASKGFSYYLPKSAQRHLQELLKQLPPTVRPIYDEYYRDLMCAKACAPESAVAIANFVTNSFPNITKKHNAFASKMNEEINSNEHEGYVPVMFPIVGEPEIDVKADAATPSGSMKRKRVAETALLFSPEPASKKTARTKSDTQPATELTLSHSPAQSPYLALRPSQSPPIYAESLSRSPREPHADGVPSPTPESTRTVDVEQATSPDHRHRGLDPRSSSLLLNVPSNADLQDQHGTVEEPPAHLQSDDGHQSPVVDSHCTLFAGQGSGDQASTAPLADDGILAALPALESTPRRPLPGDEQWRTVPLGDRDGEDASMLPPATSLMGNPDMGMSDELATITKSLEETVAEGVDDTSASAFESEPESGSNYALLSEDQRWQDGLEAIETFPWERRGARWLAGRGLVSVHHDGVERSAGLFKGNHWDDSGAVNSVQQSDEELVVSNGEEVADVL